MSFADVSFLTEMSRAKDDARFHRNLQLWIYFLSIHYELYELHKEII